MNKKILIILIVIVIFSLYCLFFTDNIDKFSQNLRLSNIYGASSSRTKNDEIYEIGIDKYIGLVANQYYKQFYIIYEKEYNNYQREDKLYEYLLVKKIEDNFKVVYNIPPRSKVEPGDNIYFSYGNFQLGPLKFMY